MSNNTAVITEARKYLGQGGATFCKYCGIPVGSPFCDAYVTTIMGKTGNAKLYCDGAKEVNCPHSIKWCYKNLALIPLYLALPADVIFFDWNDNNVPDHVGFVEERISDQEIRTIEGNTTSKGIVAERTRKEGDVQAVFRIQYAASYKIGKLTIDGYFGYNSIAMLQKVLGIKVDGILGQQTVKALQKAAGSSQDGAWGPKTSKAVQKMIGTTRDGWFGPKSVKALQIWINNQYAKKQTNAQKIGAKANELAYAGEPPEAKYPSGHAKAEYKKALNEVYPDRKAWKDAACEAGASCCVFAMTVIRSSGVDKSFPWAIKKQIAYLAQSPKFTCVSTAPTEAMLKDGDIIVYEYTSGGYHIMICHNGKVKHASVNKWYGKTTSIGSRLKKNNKKWIKVYRAK